MYVSHGKRRSSSVGCNAEEERSLSAATVDFIAVRLGRSPTFDKDCYEAEFLACACNKVVLGASRVGKSELVRADSADSLALNQSRRFGLLRQGRQQSYRRRAHRSLWMKRESHQL